MPVSIWLRCLSTATLYAIFKNFSYLFVSFKFYFRLPQDAGLRRRVRTTNYEYSENSEIVGEAGIKHPKGIIESLITKLFTLAFLALLAPIKTVEYTCEKIAWIFGLKFVHLLLKVNRSAKACGK